jgi:hypothetical protein
MMASLDYELMDELSLGVGYYNLANEIAPNGTRRGLFSSETVLWSPDARVFFDLTANLDQIYERATGAKSKKASTSARAELNRQHLGAF